MGNNFEKITIRKDTKKRLCQECVDEYLKHHPEMRHVKITQDKILYEVCEYYIKH